MNWQRLSLASILRTDEEIAALRGRPQEDHMYRIEIEHEGHWLVGRDSGIDDLGGQFRTRKEARETIKACADTERMEGRVMPRTRIIDMRPVSAAARALGSIRTAKKARSSAENGAKGDTESHRRGGRPRKPARP